jgi:hypothetical protein
MSSNNDASELAVRDKSLQQLHELTQHLQHDILSDIPTIEKSMQKNKYLKSVYADYKNYHMAVIAEKRAQIQVLSEILAYLDGVSVDMDSGINRHQHQIMMKDKDDITNEIMVLNKEINELLTMRKTNK